ncbi:phage holin [Lysinibacillus sp. FSL M8-0355]
MKYFRLAWYYFIASTTKGTSDSKQALNYDKPKGDVK